MNIIKIKTTYRPSIAIVTYYYKPLYGGMETQILVLSQYLSSKGYKITVFTSNVNGTLSDEYTNNIHIRRFGAAENVTGLKQAYNEIFQEIINTINDFDILYMPLGVSHKYPLNNQLEVAKLFFKHQKPVVLRITSSGRIQEFMNLYSNSKSFLQQTSKIIALNKGISLELKSAGVKNNSIFEIPNGVDVNLFTPNNANKNQKSKKNILPKFIYPCRICEKKKLKELIFDWDIASKANKIIKNSELLIIGDDNRRTEDMCYYEQVKKMICCSNSNIKLISSVDYSEMPGIYRNSDVFICYSFQEGMSNATLEAMSSGLPVIAPKTDAFHSLLCKSPNFTFEQKVNNKIGTIIKAAEQHENWGQIGLFNRNRIVTKFSLDKVLPSYNQMFMSLIK